MAWRRLIKFYHCGWLTVWVYRLTPPYDHFGRPINFEIIKTERRVDFYRVVAYGDFKFIRGRYMEWTRHSKLIERDKKFMEEKHEDIRPQLRVITGGKPPTDTINWLNEIKEQTTFLCRDRNDGKVVDLDKYTLNLRFEHSSWLTLHLIDRDVDPVYVDTLRFSLRKELVEIIEEVI